MLDVTSWTLLQELRRIIMCCAWTLCSHPYKITCINDPRTFTITSQDRHYCPHFIDEETEDPRGKVTFLSKAETQSNDFLPPKPNSSKIITFTHVLFYKMLSNVFWTLHSWQSYKVSRETPISQVRMLELNKFNYITQESQHWANEK